MPARIVLVHDDPTFTQSVVEALKTIGHDVVVFDDVLVAWEALREASTIEILVTRVQFGPGRPHGIALAQWARASRPRLRVLFTARPEYAPHAEGIGVFLPMPVEPRTVLEAVRRILASDRELWQHRPFEKPH